MEKCTFTQDYLTGFLDELECIWKLSFLIALDFSVLSFIHMIEIQEVFALTILGSCASH